MSVTRTEPGVASSSVPPPEPAPTGHPVPRSVVAAAVLSLLVGVGLRIWVPTPLWLDEALSVNIAALGPTEIVDALRRDGHPPLYYLLLHGWMQLFGDSDAAVRGLSVAIGVATIPLAWWYGRRRGGPVLGWLVVAVVATSPFAIRYSTEVRMYGLVMFLVLAGMLVVDHAFTRERPPGPLVLGAVTLLSAALLYSHYWAIWFLGVVGGWLLWVAWRNRDGRRNTALRLAGSLVAGGVLFLPWVPTLLYQAAHTGTPWAPPFRPSGLVATTIADFGGGGYRDAQAVGWTFVIFALLGLFARAVDGRFLRVDLRTERRYRPEAVVLGATLGVGSIISVVTSSAYASRYAAVVFPLFALLVAAGLSRFRSVPVLVVLTLVVAAGGVAGGVHNAITERTQLGSIAARIEAEGSDGDLVVYCPDQLGVAGTRELADRFEESVYPTGDRPGFVDWVDYAERNAEADPVEFARMILERAEGRRIWLVWNPGYRTFEEQCDTLWTELATARVATDLVAANGGQWFENASLTMFAPA